MASWVHDYVLLSVLWTFLSLSPRQWRNMYCACVPGDVCSQHSCHLRDISKSSVWERLRSEADRVTGSLRRRQRCDVQLSGRHSVVRPTGRRRSNVVAETGQQRKVRLRLSFSQDANPLSPLYRRYRVAVEHKTCGDLIKPSLRVHHGLFV